MEGSFYRKEDNPSEPELSQEEQVNALMPAPLYQKVLGTQITGILLIVVFVVFAITYRASIHPIALLSGALLGVYVLMQGVFVRRKWLSGRIEERVYRCVSCKRFIPFSVTVLTRALDRRYNSYYDLVCTETEDELEEGGAPHLYEFRVGRGGDQIVPGGLVILYVDVNSPRAPVAWKAL